MKGRFSILDQGTKAAKKYLLPESALSSLTPDRVAAENQGLHLHLSQKGSTAISRLWNSPGSYNVYIWLMRSKYSAKEYILQAFAI